MPGEPECYGGMLPDPARLEYNEPYRGRAFAVLLKSHGIGCRSREVSIDQEQWNACGQCSPYRPCCDLSVALPRLHRAVQAT